MRTQSGARAGMSRSAVVLEWVTVTACPAFSSRARAISAWVGLSSTMWIWSRRAMRALLGGATIGPGFVPSQGSSSCGSRRRRVRTIAMTRLLGPGVGLMNRLRYPQKFLLISCLFALPLVLLSYLWLDQIANRLSFTQRERAGLKYVVALRLLLEPLQRTQALSILPPADRPVGTLEIERGRIAVAVEAVDRVDRRLGPVLDTADFWPPLRSRLADASTPPGPLVADTLRLLAHVGDSSNLILDTELDSYYLMDAVVTRLPDLADQLRAVGVAMIEASASGSTGPVLHGQAVAARTRAAADREALERGHAVAFKVDPELRSALEARAASALAAADNLLRIAPDTIRVAPTLKRLAAVEIFALYGAASDAVFAHMDAAAGSLRDVLARRVHELRTHRALLIGLVVTSLAVVAYLWVAFYVSV